MQRKDFLISIFILLFLLFIYLSTMPSTVYWQDAGIYLSGIYVEGNVYPPGFPLYMILVHFWTKIIPSISFTGKVHAFSALWGALSGSICYLIVKNLLSNKNTLFAKNKALIEDTRVIDVSTSVDSVKKVASLSGLLTLTVSFFIAVVIGLNFNVWAQAINAEVYTLHQFFFSFLLLLLIILGKKGKIDKNLDSIQKKIILVMAVLYGLSYGNHPMTIVLLPLFFYIFMSQKNIFYHKKLLSLSIILFFLCGLLPYLYLPLTAIKSPALNWGNPDDINRFLNHVTGKTYITGEQSFAFGDISRYQATFQEFLWEYGYAGLALAVLGAYTIFKKDRILSSILAIILIFHILFAIFYKQTTEYNSWLIPAHIVTAIYIGYFLHFLLQDISDSLLHAGKRVKATSSHPFKKYVKDGIFILLTVLFLLFISSHWLDTYRELNRKNYYYAQDFGENILRNLEPDSLIIMTGDQESSTIMYLQSVLNYRTDVISFNIIETEELAYPEGRANIRRKFPKLKLPNEKFFSSHSLSSSDYYNVLVNSNFTSRSIYLMSKNIFDLDPSQYSLLPVAAMYKVIPAACPECEKAIDLKYWNFVYHDPAFYLKKERPLMSLKDPSRPGGINRVPFLQHMINFELQSWKNLGDLYLKRGECKKAADSYNNMQRLDSDIFTKVPQIKESLAACS